MNKWSIDAQFATVRVVGDSVLKRGKIFQAGDYPDKGVNITVDDLRRGAPKFTPCHINSEHWPSVFDGKLGELIAVDIQDDGAVFGTTLVPKALDDLLGGDPIPVSIELSPDPDRAIIGLALAKNPRVTDAAIFAAFSMTPPKPKDDPKPMSLKQRIIDLFAKSVADLPDDLTTPFADAKPEPTEALRVEMAARARLEAELATMKAESEARIAAERNAAITAQAAQLETTATEFARALATDRRILPGQIESVAKQYTLAVKADAGTGAMFSAEGKVVEGEAVASLRAMFAAQPQHRLTIDEMGGAAFKALNGDKAGDEGVSEERKNSLMGKSSLGRQAMKMKGSK